MGHVGHDILIRNIRESGSGSLGEVYIDGVEMKGVISIKISASVNELPNVTIVLVPESLEVKGNMKVEIIKDNA